MLRILFVIIDAIFISTISLVSNRETIIPSVFIFFSIQYIYILKQYIEEKSTEKIMRRESFIFFSLLLLIIAFKITTKWNNFIWFTEYYFFNINIFNFNRSLLFFKKISKFLFLLFFRSIKCVFIFNK